MTDKFYFANLGADVMRCIRAAKDNDIDRYNASVARAYGTLDYIHKAKNFLLYEEGLLLMRGLALAKADDRLDIFSTRLNTMIGNLRF